MDLTIELESDHFATTDAVVRTLSWTDVLGRAYRGGVEVDVRVADFDASVLLGSDVRIRLSRPSGEARLVGLIAAVTELSALSTGVRLALEIVPALELLALRQRSRIFQDKTAADIIQAVLGDELATYGRSFTSELGGEYATREYCVQYQESDRDFVCRLMEEEGIFFSFDHAGDVEELTLRDSNDSAPRVDAGEGGTIPYRTASGFALGEHEAVVAARWCAETTPTRVATRHWDWSNVANVEGSDDESDAAGPTAERYEHGHGFTLTLADFAERYGSSDAAPRARVWREGHSAPRLRLRGSSTVTAFAPGLVFELADHPVPEANGEHLLVSVTHHVTAGADTDDAGTAREYENEFEAQPKSRPFRSPRLTPRPAIPGVETAIVVGPSGDEIHTEQYGRVRVQFHWDREGQSDERSSCWLRVAQPWAGANWGWVWTPRIGMEVVVRFEHGDPDRPLVTGALYDGTNTPPYALPAEKTKSTIKSNSSLGGGGFNELRFEDKAGSEEVFQHAQKNLDEVVLDNHTTDVGAHQSNEVDHDQTQHVVGNQEETIKTTQNLDVGGNRTVIVHGGFEETVKGSQTRTVKQGSTETIAGGETHKVLDGGQLEVVTGKETRTVKNGGLNDTLHDFAALLVTGAVTETVSGAMHRKAASILHDASASMTMTGTSGIDMNGNTNITITSPSYMKVTTRKTETVVNAADGDKIKLSIFPRVINLAGAQAQNVNYAIELTKDKKDYAVLSAGAYGLTMSLLGGKVANKAAAWVDLTAFALGATGFRRVNSG